VTIENRNDVLSMKICSQCETVRGDVVWRGGKFACEPCGG